MLHITLNARSYQSPAYYVNMFHQNNSIVLTIKNSACRVPSARNADHLQADEPVTRLAARTHAQSILLERQMHESGRLACSHQVCVVSTRRCL